MSIRASEREVHQRMINTISETPDGLIISTIGNGRFDGETKKQASRSNVVRRRSSTVWGKRSGYDRIPKIVE